MKKVYVKYSNGNQTFEGKGSEKALLSLAEFFFKCQEDIEEQSILSRGIQPFTHHRLENAEFSRNLDSVIPFPYSLPENESSLLSHIEITNNTFENYEDTGYILSDEYSMYHIRSNINYNDLQLERDVLQIYADNVSLAFHNNSKIENLGGNQDAHNDAIQLIPHNPLYGGERNNIEIMNARISAKGSKLQGIFASDGVFQNIRISNTSIETDSQHYISISGLCSGRIINTHIKPRDDESNYDGYIRLDPIRLGGYANIWIIEPLDYTYNHNIVPNGERGNVRDFRFIGNDELTYITDSKDFLTKSERMVRKSFNNGNINSISHGIIYRNFPVQEFRQRASNELDSINKGSKQFVLKARQIAKEICENNSYRKCSEVLYDDFYQSS